MIGHAFGRLGIAARIGIAIGAAVAAVQALVALVFLLNPPALPPLYSARWLSDTAATLVRAALSEGDLSSALKSVTDGEALAVSIDHGSGRSGDPPWPFNRVAATIKAELPDVQSLVIEAEGGLTDAAIAIVPANFLATRSEGPLEPGEDLLAPPMFHISVGLGDGRWLTISPAYSKTRARLVKSLAFIFAGTLVIAAIAVLTSRSLITPLTALAKAADRLGREREITETSRSAIPELAAIHDAFEAMQRRLKRFVDERTHTLAAISHDLRTPLARLRIQTEFVADPAQRQAMLANLDEMRDMLAETLIFASGDASSEPSVAFDLSSVLISLCDEASDSGARIDYEGPNRATAFGRRTAVRRVFTNLIENAVRYGGVARVSLSKGESDWVVTVADEGPGIPEDLLEKAFEPFQRLESSRNRESGGTGLGLTIARDIVLAHGGRIALANATAGKGLVVTVLLPRGSA